MLESILISDEEMSSLPDGLSGFLAYETLCRTKLEAMLKRYGDNDNDMDPRVSYLTNVLSAAEYFDIPVLRELELDQTDNFGYGEARSVAHTIQREVTRLRFKALKEKRPSSVEIPEAQNSKLEHLIEQLRQRVKDSDLDERKRKAVNRKLDELLATLKGGKPNFRDTMVILASIFTVVNQAEGAIIKLPDTVSALMEVFGLAQEEAEQKLIEARAAKAVLTDQSSRTSESEIDEEIPF